MKDSSMQLWVQNLQHMWRSRKANSGLPHVGKILQKKSLTSVFQPMVALNTGVVYGHEALVRVPRSLGELSFDNLMDAAQVQRCQQQLELACIEYAIEQWMGDHQKGMLYVNISAKALVQMNQAGVIDSVLALLRKHRLLSSRFGLDITGYTRVGSADALVEAVTPLRAAGVSIALDDFKASDAGMRVYTKVLPNIVKMAPRWTRGIEDDLEISSVVSSMVRMTKKHGCLLLAKSVESEPELRTMRQLGVNLAQGFFLGSPSPETIKTVNLRAHAVLTADTH